MEERLPYKQEAAGSSPVPPMRFWVYVLELSGKQRLYIGHTECLQRRLREHLEGKTPSVRGHRIVRLLHVEEFQTRAEAVRRERYLKTSRGRSRLIELMERGSTHSL